MNQEKKDKLTRMSEQVRIGGKGVPRRKKKVIHRTAVTDDKKLQLTLKKLGVNSIPQIEEVNMIKDDGQVIHFNNPKVQASLGANTFSVIGLAETKPVTDLMPEILTQLGSDYLMQLQAKNFGKMRSPPREITEMLPGILNQLGTESLSHLKRLAENTYPPGVTGDNKTSTDDIDEDDDVPELVENFDVASKGEGV